jgi:hypothetical protein
MLQAPTWPLPVCHVPPEKAPTVRAAQGAAPGPSGSFPGVPSASTQFDLLCVWKPQVPFFIQCHSGRVAGVVPGAEAASRAVYQPPLLLSKFQGTGHRPTERPPPGRGDPERINSRGAGVKMPSAG